VLARLQTLAESVIDHLIGQVDSQIRRCVFYGLKDVMPEAGHLGSLKSAFVVYAELNAIDFGALPASE
jgi:hypothetical protein